MERRRFITGAAAAAGAVALGSDSALGRCFLARRRRRSCNAIRSYAYTLEIFTPDEGAGGTDKHPLLMWSNDIGLSHSRKFNGRTPGAFERNTCGLRDISSPLELHKLRLTVRLTHDGGDADPPWRLGTVTVLWGTVNHATWHYNVDLYPGQSVDTTPTLGGDSGLGCNPVTLEELPV